MNLREFLNYRTSCPLCDNNLSTFFHSQKQQAVKFEEDRLVFQLRMDGLKKYAANYKVGFSFGRDDGSWQLEVYQSDSRLDSYLTTSVMSRFRELNKNLGDYKFYRQCTHPKCNRFNYSSNLFKLNFKEGRIQGLTRGTPDLNIQTEYIGMTEPVEGGFKIYKLLNDYAKPSSTLVYGRYPDEYIARADWGTTHPPIDSLGFIQMPLVRFTSRVETMDRLNKLLLFS